MTIVRHFDPRAGQAGRMAEQIERLGEFSAPFGGSGAEGNHSAPLPPDWVWIKITAATGTGPTKYSWTLQVETTTVGTFADDASGAAGTATSYPAICVPDNANVPTSGSAIVKAWPGAGGEYLVFFWAPPALTVEEVDGSPSAAGIRVLRFDQADGFVVTSVSVGIARVDQTPASLTAVGYVTIAAQSFEGDKTFNGIIFARDANGVSGRMVLGDPAGTYYGAVSWGTRTDGTRIGPTGIGGACFGSVKSSDTTKGNFITCQGAGSTNIYLGGEGNLAATILNIHDGTAATNSYVPGITGTAGGGAGGYVSSLTTVGGVVTAMSGGVGVFVTDGDKGDITIASSGTSYTIDNDTVTYAKMQDVSAASKLLGRGSAAGAGDPQEITVGSNLAMSGTTLSATPAGSDTYVQFNNAGAFGGSAHLTYDSGTKTLFVDGVVAVPGSSGAETFKWNNASTAPSTAGGTPTRSYGGDTNYCGDPDAWVLININGTDYKLPAFL